MTTTSCKYSSRITNKHYAEQKGFHYAVFNDANICDNGTMLFTPHGKGYEEGDVILVHLNLKEEQIRISINEEDQGIAYNKIEKGEDIKYRFMVTTYYTNYES